MFDFFLGGARSIQLSYEDLYKIVNFGSFFELIADMSFPPGGWSAITLGGGRSILLSYRNIYDFFPYFQGFLPFGSGLPGFQIVLFSLDVLDVF